MQAGSSGSIYGRCICCLAKGQHRHGAVYIKIFKRCLNLIVDLESQIDFPMCLACISFVNKVQRFRKMVLASQRRLHEAANTQASADETEEPSQNDSKIVIQKVKIEMECDSPGPSADPEDILAVNIIGIKEEIASNNSETDVAQEDISDWESFEVVTGNKTEIKIENDETDTSKDDYTKCTRKTKHEPAITVKPIHKLINQPALDEAVEKTSRLENKRNQERNFNLLQKSADATEEDEYYSDIVKIIKHSTVIPFSSNLSTKSTFRCFYCNNKYFVAFRGLREHMETEHTNVCENTIINILWSSRAIVTCVDISCIKCKLCDEKLESIESLTEHLHKIHKKIFFNACKTPPHGVLGLDMSMDTPKCHICDKKFSYFGGLKIHMNEHYGHLVCSVCGKKYMSKRMYEVHISRGHNERKGIECTFCHKILISKSTLENHLSKEHRKFPVKCPKCPKMFPYGHYTQRINHMAEEHGAKKPVHKCDTCDKEYNNEISLYNHKRATHKRKKEFKCDKCGYITTDGSYMRKHLDRHNGLKNYECGICKKKLASTGSLNLHMRMHANDKRFACSLCDAAFIQKHCLKSHLKSKHPDADNN